MRRVYEMGLTGQVTPAKYRPNSTYDVKFGQMFMGWVCERPICHVERD
jgi:hypothetical protein